MVFSLVVTPPGLEGGAKDYLIEATLAHDPPFGTFYDTTRAGTPAPSLGMYEKRAVTEAVPYWPGQPLHLSETEAELHSWIAAVPLKPHLGSFLLVVGA